MSCQRIWPASCHYIFSGSKEWGFLVLGQKIEMINKGRRANIKTNKTRQVGWLNGNWNVLKSRTAAQRKAARNPENVQEIAKSSDLCSSHQLPMPNFNWLTKPIKSHDSRFATIVHSVQGHVILGAMPISLRDWCGVADATRVLKAWH